MFFPERLEDVPIDRTVFLPGKTTDGHYQIELACNACHTERFADQAAIQTACVDCHGEELTRVDDSHPRTKFTDPRNADRVEVLDARWCVTCHQEHRPEVTSTMGLSLQTDYCYRCHEDIGTERLTHADLPFDSCSNVGCHNFHDNRALYEDFLVEHRNEPELVALPRVAPRNTVARLEGRGQTLAPPLARRDFDAPPSMTRIEPALTEWADSAHAKGGVNCMDCHADNTENTESAGAWVDRAPIENCAGCHEAEHEGFTASRHGMRLAAGLGPMTPGKSRLAMSPEVSDRQLDCNQCHPAHGYDTRHAAADACLECHVDEHSRAFEASPHAERFRDEIAGRAPAGSGVSCATCHLPRIPDASLPGLVRVAHNQNDTLRPRDKMIRASCLDCHGLGFSIDALADPALVTTNYRGRPAARVESIHFATVLRFELEGRKPPFGDNQNQEEIQP